MTDPAATGRESDRDPRDTPPGAARDGEGVGAASPPGDLPLSEVQARLTLQGRQFRHDNPLAPLAPRPGEPVEVWAASGASVDLGRAAVYYTTDGAQPTVASPSVPMPRAGVEWDPLAGYVTRWRALLPAQHGGATVRYRVAGWIARGLDADVSAGEGSNRGDRGDRGEPDIWAHDGQGFWFRYPGRAGITTFAYRVEPEGPPLPAWAQDAVIYHIFLDRFHPGTPDGRFPSGRGPNERHGGTLTGVYRALPYLHDLGVTCLWLSPLHPSHDYHRYDGTDHRGIDPDLGTAADLRALTAAAHDRGMRVLLDYVPSHASARHPAFLAARRDRAAPTAAWFTFTRWPDHYRNFLDRVPGLPSFDTRDPGARAYLIDSAVSWLRDYGIDGFRLDHAIGPSMDFWVAFRAATRATRPDVVSIGEATDTPDALRRYRNRLDGVLDFPLARALRSTFGTADWDLVRLDSFLRAHEEYMATGPGRVGFLDNHDMNRFLFVAGGRRDRLKLAALCLFTLEAVPTIYYGSEIGLSQQHDIGEVGLGGDALARQDMPWDPTLWDGELLAFYRALIRLRRGHAALRRGRRATMHLDAAAGTYAYTRALDEQEGAAEGAPELVIALNVGDGARTVILPAPEDLGTYRCLLTTAEQPRIAISDRACHVTLGACSGVALARSS